MVGGREERSREGFLKELLSELGFDRKNQDIASVTSCVQVLGYLQ